ncbi:hypothetical protein K435DRAFT_823770 [Dendrothele bispora CBS 962.96]|uniref:CNH domain-containing protein n=1 Tax=Dendrothele bispora (strain CBS 962.96) TaxID=1314807 RepID=A0A4S8KVV0_DENBC|nr:hypothetical protein K435DRAFT_823770 [Dendrothele bispora CBS 962.96]
MSSAPLAAVAVPPYQVQPLIESVFRLPASALEGVRARCAQAYGSEIYVGCSNGELMRFALQADDPNKLESYTILSRQSLPNEKPIDDILLVPSIMRALVQSDNQLHFYTIPSLDPVPSNVLKPVRHVITFTVDHKHLMRPPPLNSAPIPQPVDLCIVKRNALSLYALREKLFYQKEIPFPPGGTLARRIGPALCIADKENYNVVNLEKAESFPLLPLCQVDADFKPDPFITVTGDDEFLICSWTGQNTLGVFINSNGDPVRGTLEWPTYPKAVCLDYPYITTLLPNDTIEIHNIESQNLAQVIPAPAPSSPDPSTERARLVSSLSGYLVPSTQRSSKMRMVPVRLLRGFDVS